MSKWFVAALIGASFVIVTLQSVTVRTAAADSSCQDWEVQWWTPLTAPVKTSNSYTAPHADPSPNAAPPGWEPISGSFGQGTSGYALRHCVR